LHGGPVAVNHYHWNIVRLELTANDPADAAVATDDVMVLHGSNLLFQFAPPEDGPYLQINHRLGNHTQQIRNDADSEKDDEDREYFSLFREIADFPVTNGGNGNDCHVKGIEKTPALDKDVSGGTHAEDSQKDRHPPDDPHKTNGGQLSTPDFHVGIPGWPRVMR